MSEFLTAEWIAELDANARVVAISPDLGGLTVEQVVSGGPRGEVRYHLQVADGALRVVAGGAAAPDLRFLVDYEIAVGLHRGELTLQEALASGRCRLEGPLQGLRGREAALRDLEDVFGAVRARTTYT